MDMKKALTLLIVLAALATINGCTQIEKIEPASGPPGTTVFIKATGMWGNPMEQYLKWDGEIISDPFPGSFTIPTVTDPGEHKITLVDQLDADEAFLLFTWLRFRTSSTTFTVTER
jgi:hypothetical protein